LKQTTRISTILIHLVSWLALYALFCFVNSINTNYSFVFWLDNIYYSFLVNVATAYFVVYFLFPRFLYRKKFISFVLLFLPTLVVSIFVTRLIYFYIVLPLKWPDALANTTFFGFSYLNGFSSQFVIIGLLSIVELTRKWVREQSEKNKLKTENLANELKLLKSQLSPHFLFNTLNNIDSLIYKDQKRASGAVVKLSELLRYMLYDANLNRVKLKDEIDFINSILELQKLRLIDEKDVSFIIDGNLENQFIAPMLLTPFIENMFKHGSLKGNSPLFQISIKVEGQKLKLYCKNHIRDSRNMDERSGIGLKNVLKRLGMLYGGNGFKLKIVDEQKEFEVFLELQLDQLKKFEL